MAKKYSLQQRVTALESLVNVLILTLAESGALKEDRLYRHVCGVTNDLEHSGLVDSGVVRLLDEIRATLPELCRPA